MPLASAAAAALGGWFPFAWALPLASVAAVGWIVLRHPAAAVLAVALTASGLADRSLDGLQGKGEGQVAAEIELLTDPAPSFGGLRFEARLGGRRVEARAGGAVAEPLRDRLAGEVVSVRGFVSPLLPDRAWRVARHLSGRLSIHAVDGWRPGHPPARLANGLRRTLEGGAASLPPRQRALFTGLVVGDDRAQPPDLADAFLGAGLTHLLAVSGQNVAFVLTLASPGLRRLRIWPRWLASTALITLFGVVTRFEPSVLRASVMAALATGLVSAGAPAHRLRVLALAVTGLLLVDPLLVRSVGFQLSVAACLAIVTLAARVAAAVPGPRPLREAVGVTVAAQLGVAPVLLHTFGPIPLASLPANLLAVPVAGWVMVWGLTAGLVAGVAGPTAAALLHLPTRLALSWLEVVAGGAARAGLGELGWAHGLVAATGMALVIVGGRGRRAGWLLVAAATVAATLSAQAPPPLRTPLGPGVVRWHAGTTDVVVLGDGGRTSPGPARTLEVLRRARVGAIAVLVVADGSVEAATVAAIRAAHPTGRTVVAAPAGPDHPGGVAVHRSTSFVAGDLQVRVTVAAERLVVDAARLPDRGG